MESVEARQAFIEERRTGIGGSDAPVILGVPAPGGRTPLQVWMEKTGRAASTPDNAILRRGRKLEPVVVSEYEEETGRKVSALAGRLVHPKWPWMGGNIDRIIEPGERGTGILEAKAANLFKIREWEDEAPLAAQVQLQHYLTIAEALGLADWGSVAGLLGGLAFKYQDLDFNREFAAQLVEREAAFWRLVETDTPPEPTADDAKALGKLFATITGETVDLPAEAVEWDRQRLEAGAEIKRLEELKDEAENKLRFAIGSAECGNLPGGKGRYTWKLQQRAEYVVKATEFRVLRRAK